MKYTLLVLACAMLELCLPVAAQTAQSATAAEEPIPAARTLSVSATDNARKQSAANFAPSAPTASATAGFAGGDPVSDYRLGVADSVRVIVFNEPTLSGEFSIGGNGMLSMPLIGGVQASGRTSTQLAADIEAKLADGYLRTPHVSIDVLTYRPFYILGEVTKPGEYPYANGLTVMAAVATAQGFTYRANKRKVYVKRNGDDKELELQLAPNMLIFPGDTIRVAERHF